VLTDEELARHTRIFLGAKDHDKRPAVPAHTADNTSPWHVSSMDTALAALEAGLGYAWLPLNRIEQLVLQGRLKLLPMPAHYLHARDFYLVHAHQASSGIGANSLSSLLHSHAALLSSIDCARSECGSAPA
jgi:DNA-binding transcriptional LysR family regulator